MSPQTVDQEGVVEARAPAEDVERPLAVRSVERTLAGRYSTYINEIQRLIEAGRAVMEREQTMNPRVSDIVAEAGLSNQAFYRHFRSKSELMLAILDDGSRLMADYVEKHMARYDSGIDKIRAWVAGSLTQTAASTAASVSRGVILNTLELRAEYPEESTQTSHLLRRPLEEAVRLAQQQGEIPAVDPELATEMAFRLTMAMMETWLIARRVPSEAELDYLESFVLSGLGAELPAEPRSRRAERDRRSGN
jgi:AcrR family transcriptional regulator